jgi:hypothetical protein
MTLDDWFDVQLIELPNDDRLANYQKEFKYCMPLCNDDGWFLEFGVWKGRTINLCSGLRPNNHFYGFDSFEGLPEEWKLADDNSLSHITQIDKGHFALGQLPKVNSNVTLTKGFFDKTLDAWIEDNLDNNSVISWLHVDCDLYSSAKYVLDKLNPYIVPGTVIRFDELVDWRLAGFENNFQHDKPKSKYSLWPQGEWKALHDWLSQYDRKVKPTWREWHQGAGLIVEA